MSAKAGNQCNGTPCSWLKRWYLLGADVVLILGDQRVVPLVHLGAEIFIANFIRRSCGRHSRQVRGTEKYFVELRRKYCKSCLGHPCKWNPTKLCALQVRACSQTPATALLSSRCKGSRRTPSWSRMSTAPRDYRLPSCLGRCQSSAWCQSSPLSSRLAMY